MDLARPIEALGGFLQPDAVSRNTMRFALPESLRDYIDQRVRSGDYGNTSEYLRDLIRRDQHDAAARRQHVARSFLVREFVAAGMDGLDTDPPEPWPAPIRI